jgi:lipid A 4'-phosphatase
MIRHARPPKSAAGPEKPEMAKTLAWFAASFLLLCGGLILVPSIDLWATGLFYRNGFYLGDWTPFRLIRTGLPYAVWIYAIVVSVSLIVTLIRRRTMFGLDTRAACFLLLALALGPGLTVNTIFKEHWGRARPSQIVEFGGDKKFSPAFVPSDQCTRNCSFTAGDPSMGFYLVSLAFLATVPRRRNLAIGAAVGAGALLGVVRLAQGGHFLSDIVTSGFIVVAISWALHRAIVVHDGLGALNRALRHPSPGLKRFAVVTLATIPLFALSYAVIDRPLAQALQNIDPAIRAVFAVVTKFGEGVFYLVPSGLVALWALWTHRRALLHRAGFVFAAVAIPGLIADVAKPVFGRARPQMLFREDVFGFTWHGARANYWSFPSGHTITITALALSLTAVYPRLWPLYAAVALLVASSRVIIDAHYLSDVIAGAYIGLTAYWCFAAIAEAKNIPLRLKAQDSP